MPHAHAPLHVKITERARASRVEDEIMPVHVAQLTHVTFPASLRYLPLLVMLTPTLMLQSPLTMEYPLTLLMIHHNSHLV